MGVYAPDARQAVRIAPQGALGQGYGGGAAQGDLQYRAVPADVYHQLPAHLLGGAHQYGEHSLRQELVPGQVHVVQALQPVQYGLADAFDIAFDHSLTSPASRLAL